MKGENDGNKEENSEEENSEEKITRSFRFTINPSDHSGGF
jgi:hypothetical protein